MEPEIPDNVLEKIKSEFEGSPSFLRGLRGDYGNIRLHRTSGTHTVAFGDTYELTEYQVPLLDTEGKPLLDKSGKRDFRIISIYFAKNEELYTLSDFLKRDMKS